MKIKPKGRKIYRYKTRFERLKGFLRDTRASSLTVIGAGVFVFVGYSIGAPVMDFLKKQEILVPSSIEETDPVSVHDTTAPTEKQLEPPVQQHSKLCGYYLDKSALSTQKTLEEALSAIPDGITHVIVPLKAEGGRLYYGTRLADAGMCGAVIAATPLETIYSTVLEKGYIPVASINALEDSIYPQTYAEAAYKIEGSTEKWLDADGKPRLSPFSELTLDYLANLTDEIVHTGFSVVLCEGIVFPDFTQEDLQMLDPRTAESDRAAALASVVDVMKNAAGDVAFYVSIDGNDLLSNNAELMDSSEIISVTGIVVTADAQTAHQKQQILDQVSGFSCLIQLEGEGGAQSVAIDGSYILRP